MRLFGSVGFPRKATGWANYPVWLSLLFLLLKTPPSAFAFSNQWLSQARVAGAEMFKEMSDFEAYNRLSELKAQRVSVIEGISQLSNYLTIAQYDSEMTFIARATKIAHQLDLKLVWYYPALEVLTPLGERADSSSMFKDHPDWMQYGLGSTYADLSGLTPNVFYDRPASGVEPETESAWMCHLSPYRDYYFERIQKLAATGADGIWVDVPLFSNALGLWCCSNAYCRQKFENDTGMAFPTSTDLENFAPNFRRWMIWRHTELNQFLIDIRDQVRAVNPDFEVIIEIVTCDYNSATHQGLDGTYLGEVEGLTICWEIDALSDDNAMRNARQNDWYNLIALNKFGRGISSDGMPSWAFTYGFQADDAELVMAEALAAQLNPYDTKIPQMTTVVSPQYRARMFSFIENYEDLIFSSESMARVAILYSSSSRDFIDYDQGTALYTTTSAPNALQQWWTSEPGDGLLETDYIAEYRGWVKLLVGNHIPFDIIAVQNLDPEKLARYDAIVMPNTVSLSPENGELFSSYLDSGGVLLVTGPAPFSMDEFGEEAQNPLSDRLTAADVLYRPELLGKEFLQGTDESENKIAEVLNKVPSQAKFISTNASANVHLEAYSSDGQYILHCTNFNGVTGEFSPSAISFDVALQLPESRIAKYVTVASPNEAYNLGNIGFATNANGQVRFSLSMFIYSVVVISFAEEPGKYTSVDLPSAFGLVSNYPNPFHRATSITVQLNVDSDARIDIYNVLGQKIRTLISGNFRADTYQLQWDGTDDSGRPVAGGVYFCRLRAGVEEKVMKMFLLRR